MQRYRFVHTEGLPRFCGGLVGFMGYDMVRFFERLPSKNPDDLRLPDCVFLMTDTILIFDHVKHKIKVVSNAFVGNDPSLAYNEAVRKIDALIRLMNAPLKVKYCRSSRPGCKVTSNFTREGFMDIVKRAKAYIRIGDIIQVVPSQRFSTSTKCKGIDLYRSLSDQPVALYVLP
jgi:anthranilate synthase component 1